MPTEVTTPTGKLPAGGSNHSEADYLARTIGGLVWTDVGIPLAIASGQQGIFILPGAGWIAAALDQG